MTLPVDASTNVHTTDNAHDHRAHIAEGQQQDVIESIVPAMPIVLPICGGVLMFLLAFIAVYMA